MDIISYTIVFMVVCMGFVYSYFHDQGFAFLKTKEQNDIFIMGIMMIISHFALGVLKFCPQCHNYPFKINEKNRSEVYEMEKTFVSAIRLVINLLCSFLILLILSNGRLFIYLIFIAVIVLIWVMIFFIRTLKKINDK